MKLALLPIQTGIYTVLSGDATLIALLDGADDSIYDGVPEGKLPQKYVVIGEHDEQQDTTFGHDGSDSLVTIHVFVEDTMKQQGNAAAAAIGDQIVQLLHGAALAVAGHTLVTCEFEHATTVPGLPGSRYRHIALEFRVLTETP